MSSIFFGLRYDLLSRAETIDAIVSAINSNRLGFSRGDLNVATVVNSQYDADLKSAILNNDIINMDGVGAIWGAKFLGHPVPERIAGVDLFEDLLGVAAHRGFRVFLLGSTSEVLLRLIGALEKKYPALKIAGYNDGFFWGSEADTVKKIAASRSHMLFVGIKSPEKEIFIEKYRESLNVNFVMGVGGSFDVVSGSIKRAPIWMQRWGLEWFYRTVQEPRRMWRRYLVTNSRFGWLLVREWLRRRLH